MLFYFASNNLTLSCNSVFALTKYAINPTSIDPKQDPDYSSWGKESASVNYIGLIAYLVKANTELHERVKLLEAK